MFWFSGILLLSACGPRGGEPGPDEEEAPATAIVVCGREETRVLTPRVRARPDGVHVEVHNRLGGDAGFQVTNSEVGAGYNAPEGESAHVGDLPPGRARAGCDEPPSDGTGQIRDAAFEVVDPAGLYKPVELECPSGRAVGGSAEYVRGADGVGGDLVGATRRRYSDEIRDGDLVELAGYPKLRGIRVVRVIRDGRVTAAIKYSGEPGDWLQDSYEACEEF